MPSTGQRITSMLPGIYRAKTTQVHYFAETGVCRDSLRISVPLPPGSDAIAWVREIALGF